MTIEQPLPIEIINFWREAGPTRWFSADNAFDDSVRVHFELTHLAAARGELAEWAETAEGSLALLILLDQFPRNLYRGSAHAFATDGMARAVARQALAKGQDQEIEADLRIFFYVPFEHSENMVDQDRSVALFEALGIESYSQYVGLDREIIRRFGHFPYRNGPMGRESTADEIAYLRERDRSAS